jgi:hypothetical protein
MFSRSSVFSDSKHAGDSMDALAQAVGLQSRLNEAVEKQDFALAATLRDELQAAKVRARAHICVVYCSVHSHCQPFSRKLIPQALCILVRCL